MAAHFCLSCGLNITADVPLEVDGFLLDPRGGVLRYHGQPIFGLIASEFGVLYTLAAAEGRVVTREVLRNRCFTEGVTENSLNATISRARAILRAAQLPQPIQTFSTARWAHSGFYWCIVPAS